MTFNGKYLRYLKDCILSKPGNQIAGEDGSYDGIHVIKFPKMLRRLYIMGQPLVNEKRNFSIILQLCGSFFKSFDKSNFDTVS